MEPGDIEQSGLDKRKPEPELPADPVLKARAYQQAIVAELGQWALQETDLDRLINEAVITVTRTLQVEYCEVLELLPDGASLLLSAGAGWHEGLVGRATVGSELDSQAGYTLLSHEPVIVTDLQQETRFSGSPLLYEHEVVSGLSVIIHGLERPYGVMGIHTGQQRLFTRDDAHFLQSVANVLGTAIERKGGEEKLRQVYEAEKEARLEAERAAERLAGLQRLTAALSEAPTLAKVAAVIIEQGLVVLGAKAGSVVMLDDEETHLEVIFASGYEPALLNTWRRFEINAPVPLATAVQSGRAVFIESTADLARHYPELAEQPRSKTGAWASIPLSLEGQVAGAMGLSFAEERPFPEEDRAFILALCRQGAQAMERARLYEAERQARAAAEAANQNLAFLARASAILADSLDYETTLQQVAELTVPLLADWCAVDLLNGDGAIRRVAVSHLDPAKVELAFELRRRYPSALTDERGIGPIIRRGEPQLFPVLSDQFLQDLARDEEHLRLLRQLEVKSAMVVPLQARERVLGAMSLISDVGGRSFDIDDLALVTELGRRAALAVDNARLYGEASRLNEQLEQRVRERTQELELANRQMATEVAERQQAEEQIRMQAARTAALVRTAVRLNAQLDLDKVLTAVCEETAQALGVPIATVSLYDSKQECLIPTYGIGLPAEFYAKAEPLPRDVYERYRQEMGHSVVVGDVQELTDLPNADLYKALDVRTTVSVSMLQEGRLVGRLNVGSVGKIRAFNDNELALLQGLAEQAALAITNARKVLEHKQAEIQLEDRARQLAALGQMGQVVASSLELDVVLKRVLDQLMPLLSSEGASILLLEGDELSFAATHGPGMEGMIGQRRSAVAGLTGDALRSGAPVWVRDAAAERLLPGVQEQEEYEIQSLLIVPLKLHGTVIGIIEAVHSQPHAFNEEHLQMLEAAASWTAIAIGNARQHANLQQRLAESETLAAISQALSETLDLNQMLQRIAEAARRIIPAVEWAIIHLFDEERQLLQPVASTGIDVWKSAGYVLAPDTGFAGRVFSQGKVINVHNVQQDARHMPFHEKLRAGSLLVAPVKGLGTISVQGAASNRFSIEDERLLSALGVQAALAIQNARLYEELADEKRRLELLYNLSRDMAITLNPRQVATTALDLSAAALGALHGNIFVLEPGSDQLSLLAVSGYDFPMPELRKRAELRLGEGLTGYVAQTRNPTAVADVTRDPHWLSRPGVYEEIRSVISVPLLVGDTLVGVINLLSDRPGFLGPAHLPLLQAVATPVALSLQNARLYEAEQQARQVADTLRTSNLALSGTLDPDTVLETLLSNLGKLVPYDSANVMLLSSNGRLVVRATRGYEQWTDAEQTQRVTFSLKENKLLGRLFDTAESRLIADTAAVAEWQTVPGTEHVRNWIGVPLVVSSEVIGIFSIDKTQPGFFTERHRAITEALAAQAAIAIQNARLFEQVRIGRERLRQLTQQVVSAQEEERQRVSRELHDEAGQALTALKITLNLIERQLPAEMAAVRRQIAESASLTDQTMEQIRHLAQNLRPPALETLGLNATLEGLCQDFGSRVRLKINYEGKELPGLSDTVTISLYRFVQEALTNVAKHGDASEVNVTVDPTEDSVNITVVDNGRGFNVDEKLAPATNSSGLGLVGMQERLELLGGRLEVYARPGEGTRLVAFVPFDAGRGEESRTS